MIRISVLAVALATLAVPAHAVVTLTYNDIGTTGVDVDFEGPGGYLDTTRGQPVVNGSALAPLERSVGQLRQSMQRRAHYLPNGITGRPIVDVGTGVTQALTNVSPAAFSTADFGNNAALPFSVTRTGNIITYTFGNDVLASDARTSLGLVNAFEFRVRTEGSRGANGITYSDLVYNDSMTTGQILAGFSASNGQTAIRLFEGVAQGDFSLAGSITQSWAAGDRPGGSALATQIKLLELSPTQAIPEPSTWALMLLGFGFVGSAIRRRRHDESARLALA